MANTAPTLLLDRSVTAVAGDIAAVKHDMEWFINNTGMQYRMTWFDPRFSKRARHETRTYRKQRAVRRAIKREEQEELFYILRAILYKKALGRLK